MAPGQPLCLLLHYYLRDKKKKHLWCREFWLQQAKARPHLWQSPHGVFRNYMNLIWGLKLQFCSAIKVWWPEPPLLMSLRMPDLAHGSYLNVLRVVHSLLLLALMFTLGLSMTDLGQGFTAHRHLWVRKMDALFSVELNNNPVVVTATEAGCQIPITFNFLGLTLPDRTRIVCTRLMFIVFCKVVNGWKWKH